MAYEQPLSVRAVHRPARRRRGAGLGDNPSMGPYDAPSNVTATAAQSSAWYDVMGKFATASDQFDSAQADLASMADFISQQDQSVQDEYAALVSRAQGLQTDIGYVTTALADVKQWLAGAISAVEGAYASVAAGIKSWLGMSGLGQLPLIPIAVVAAATAAVGYFLSDYAQFAQKVALLKQYTAQGMAPADAAKAVSTALSSTSAASTVGWIVIGVAVVAALWFLPNLMGRYRRA